MLHYLLTIILGIFIAVLVQRPQWVLAYTVLILVQTITLAIVAMTMYPTRWMADETYKTDHERYVVRVSQLRVQGGESEVLIPSQ